jgi:LacI family transcriptional regulator
MDALSDHNIPFKKDLVLIKDLSEQCGVEAAMQILKDETHARRRFYHQ